MRVIIFADIMDKKPTYRHLLEYKNSIITLYAHVTYTFLVDLFSAPQHAVVTESTEGLPPLPPNPILPAISNPLPNISTITSVYPPASIVTQPPPLFTAPPPPLPMTHVHDGNMFSIPPPFPGPMNPFNSFGQFGPPPFQ